MLTRLVNATATLAGTVVRKTRGTWAGISGAACVTAGVAAFDWRVGLVVAGMLLLALDRVTD